MGGAVFGSKNFTLLILSVVLLAVGYIFLGQGPVQNPLSWTIAPVILVLVYCVLLPLAILAKTNKEKVVAKRAEDKS